MRGAERTDPSRVLTVTIPRSGTHLLDSVLQRLPPFERFERLGVNAKLRWHPLNYLPGGDRVWVGIGRPYLVRASVIEQRLRRIRPGTYGMAQLAHSQRVSDITGALELRVVAAVRDPRDVVVSQFLLAKADKKHVLHDAVSRAPDDQSGLAVVLQDWRDGRNRFKAGIGRQLDLYKGWLSEPSVLTVRFEDLVGPDGGGTVDRQVFAIQQLGAHLGRPVAEDEAVRIGGEMYGTGRTFRRGISGGWRDYFGDQVDEMFMEQAGDKMAAFGYAP